MKRVKQPKETTTLSLKEYLERYDGVTITAVINSFEASPAWDIFKSFLKLKQREAEVAALDTMARNDMAQTAAYTSGYAKGIEDVAEQFISGLKNLAFGVNPIVENDRPDEPEPKTIYS